MFAKGERMRSIVMGIVVAALVGTTACKKKGGDAAKQEPAKVQEGTAAPNKDKPAQDTPAVGVKAGGIQHEDKEGAAGLLTSATGSVELRHLGETQYAAAKADTKLYAGDTIRTGDKSGATIALADESVIEVAE